MKFFKINILVLIFTFGLCQLLIAATGPASVYKVQIRKIELCGSGSSATTCANAVTLYEGDSGEINIADTANGAAAASLGNLTKATMGQSYDWVQVTMERAFTVSGYASPDGGADTCYTNTGEAGTASEASAGSASADDQSPTTLYAGIVSTGNDNTVNSLNKIGGTSQDAGTIADGDEFMEWRGPLSTTFTPTVGRVPQLMIAFGFDNAVYAGDNMGSDCNTQDVAVGLWANEPSVTMTIQ